MCSAGGESAVASPGALPASGASGMVGDHPTLRRRVLQRRAVAVRGSGAESESVRNRSSKRLASIVDASTVPAQTRRRTEENRSTQDATVATRRVGPPGEPGVAQNQPRAGIVAARPPAIRARSSRRCPLLSGEASPRRDLCPPSLVLGAGYPGRMRCWRCRDDSRRCHDRILEDWLREGRESAGVAPALALA